MVSQNMVKVVKRAERERVGAMAAGGAGPTSSPRQHARELAARVKEWVGEFEQTRLAQLHELRRRFGFSEGDGLPRQAGRDSVEDEK